VPTQCLTAYQISYYKKMIKWRGTGGNYSWLSDDECYIDQTDLIFHNLFNTANMIFEWCCIVIESVEA